MLGQYDSIRSLLSDGSPSQFCSDRDFVNISDIADVTFLFRGLKGKSGVFFQLRFHHMEAFEVWRLDYAAFQSPFTHQKQNEYIN